MQDDATMLGAHARGTDHIASQKPERGDDQRKHLCETSERSVAALFVSSSNLEIDYILISTTEWINCGIFIQWD
jgi:hypothetical protein